MSDHIITRKRKGDSEPANKEFWAGYPEGWRRGRPMRKKFASDKAEELAAMLRYWEQDDDMEVATEPDS